MSCNSGVFHNIPKVFHNAYPDNTLDMHKSVDIMAKKWGPEQAGINSLFSVTKSFKFVEITLAIETTCLYNNCEVGENVKKWPEMGGF